MFEPDLKTYEEFIAEFEKDPDGSFRQRMWKNYQFALKERERLREKDRRSRLRKREAIPVDQRRKVGRPKKEPTGSEFPPK